ncbi:hypothetical protein [Frankia sp. CcWB2]
MRVSIGSILPLSLALSVPRRFMAADPGVPRSVQPAEPAGWEPVASEPVADIGSTRRIDGQVSETAGDAVGAAVPGRKADAAGSGR